MTTDQAEIESSSPTASVPMWFWIVGAIALLWNVMGLLAFVAEMMRTEEALQALPVEQQELAKSVPAWATVGFAVGVIAGTLGCLALLMRREFALPLFVLSLIGVLVQNSFYFFMSNTVEIMGVVAVIMPAVVIVIGIGLILLSAMASSKEWLR